MIKMRNLTLLLEEGLSDASCRNLGYEWLAANYPGTSVHVKFLLKEDTHLEHERVNLISIQLELQSLSKNSDMLYEK